MTGIGLVVVISVSILSAIAAMAFSVLGVEATDTPLEKWLDRCRYGKRERADSQEAYKTIKEELFALHSAIYAIITSFDDYRSGMDREFHFGDFDVFVPFYGKPSKVLLEAWGTDVTGRERRLASLLFEAGAVKAKEAKDHLAVLRLEAEPTLKDETLRLKGTITVRGVPARLVVDGNGRQILPVGGAAKDVSNIPYIRDMHFHFAYQPDLATLPDFTMEVDQ
jgi:hypothetical protein